MKLRISLHPERDAALIQAVQAIPPGKRAGRIRDALTQVLVDESDMATAIHRLAAVLEQYGAAMTPAGHPASPLRSPAKSPWGARLQADPAFKTQVKDSLFSNL